MRQSRKAKAETNQTVVKAASRMLRERGIDGTGVGDVMQAANKTHGGFYRHFGSKEALLMAAMEDASRICRRVLPRSAARMHCCCSLTIIFSPAWWTRSARDVRWRPCPATPCAAHQRSVRLSGRG